MTELSTPETTPSVPVHRFADAASLLAAASAEQKQSQQLQPPRQPLRQRDLAARLGVGEGELLSSRLGMSGSASSNAAGNIRVIRLRDEFASIMEEVSTLGRVMALTRNEAVVHERYGHYENISHNGPMGIALGADIDLRIFYHQWASAYAVTDGSGKQVLRSLQFYDKHADAVHKIYVKDESMASAFDAFTARWSANEQTAFIGAEPRTVAAAAPADERADSDIATGEFIEAWRAMQDTHEFFGLLRRFGVSRTQALRLAPPDLAEPLPPAMLQSLFEQAAETQLPIMVFVGNPGIIQIHTGPVVNIRMMGPWLNVLDPDFNLHLRTDLVDKVYRVRKPTADGVVTSIELFDATGQNVAMLFGARKPGKPELETWRTLAESFS